MGLFKKKIKNPYEKKSEKKHGVFKTVAIASSMVLALVVGIVAVFSVLQQNARVLTRVSFTATDVSADIYMKTTHMGGGANASDNLDIAMSGATAVPSGDANYGTYSYLVNILPTAGDTAATITLDPQTLKEMSGTATLPDGLTTYTSYVRYDFKIVNKSSSKNMGVRFEYYFNDGDVNRGKERNNLYLDFMAKDNTGTQSTAIVDGIDILAVGNTGEEYGTSEGFATFTIWVKVADQTQSSTSTPLVINITLSNQTDEVDYAGVDTPANTLANTSWKFGATPNTSTLGNGVTYNVNFTSNGEQFVGLERGSLYYVRANGTKLKAYDDTNNTWANANYRRIAIVSGIDVTNSTLLTFMGNNGSSGPEVYSITVTASHVTYSGNNTITENGSATITFTADSGYDLPSTVTVSGATPSWNSSTGVLTLTNPTGDVTVSVTGDVQLSGYTVTIAETLDTCGNSYGLDCSFTFYISNSTTHEFDEANDLGMVIRGVERIVCISNENEALSSIAYYENDNPSITKVLDIYCYDTETLILTKNITIVGIGCGCFLPDTDITVWDDKKKRWTRKKIKDLKPEDKLLVWNFDEGKLDTAEILWQSKAKTTTRYTKATFSDGGIFETTGANDSKRHAIFIKETGKFEYINKKLIGKTTVNEKGEDVKVVNVEFVDKKVEYYNVITSKHFNCYANGYLTSTVFSNIYDTKDMKYVKNGRKAIKVKGLTAYEQKMYDGLRLGEKRLSKDNAIADMAYIRSHMVTFMTESTEERIDYILMQWVMAQK